MHMLGVRDVTLGNLPEQPGPLLASVCKYDALDVGISSYAMLQTFDDTVDGLGRQLSYCSDQTRVTYPTLIAEDAIACTGDLVTDTVEWTAGELRYIATVNDDVRAPEPGAVEAFANEIVSER